MRPKPYSWLASLFTGCAVGLLAFPNAVAVQRLQDIGEYSVFRWTSGDGLPHNTVRCLLQSSDGYLWVGTKAGLARFDGVRFTVFDSSAVAEMPNDDCVSMAQDSNGSVWVGTESGLLRWNNHQFTLFDTNRSKLSSDRIRYLSASPRGGLWIATFNGLHLYNGQQFRCFGRRDGLLSDNIRAVFEDDSGAIWAGPESPEFAGNLERRRPGSSRYESLPDQKVDLDSMVHCFVQDGGHHLWWGNNHGLHELFNGKIRDYGIEDGLSGNVVKWIALSRGGGLWVVVGQHASIRGRWGLHRFENGKAVRLDLPSIGLEEDIICALEDREGNVWLGSRNDGLIRLQHRRATTIMLPRDSGAASSVSADPDGGVWIAAKDLLHFDGQFMKNYPAPLGSPRMYAVLAAPGKELLAAIDFRIASIQNGSLVISQSYRDHVEISALFCDRTGRPWIADSIRVTAGEGDRMTYFNPSTISNKVCCAIAQDFWDRIWFGTLGAGAFCYGVSESTNGSFMLVNPPPEEPTSNAPEHLVHLTTEQGLPSNRVLCIYADDSEPSVWIGTDRGLACYRAGVVYPITTKDGLFNDRVHAIMLDDSGNFWVGCSKGIYRVSRTELLDRVQGRVGSVHCISIGELDGMRNCQVTAERQPVASKGPDGLLWFATAQGVVRVNPKDFVLNELLPPVVVEQVRIDNAIVYGDPPLRPLDRPFVASFGQVSAIADERSDNRRDLRLAPGRARFLEIRYTANSLVAPERMRFKYRLDGYVDKWQIGTQERVARYTNLRPGHYHFTVTASNSDGFWNSTGAEFSFVLEPHFYTTWTFRVALAAGIIGLAFLVQNYRLGVQRRVLQIQKTAALDAERARIARDIHDDLGSRFLQLSVLGELTKRSLKERKQADEHLERLRATTNEAFQALDEIVWATNPKQDSLEGLVSYLREYFPQFLGPLGIKCHFEFPHPVPVRILSAEVRHNVFLAVKEALQNVAKHARATELVLRLDVDQRHLRVIIKDNGCGFDPVKEAGGPSSPLPAGTALGNGLANMRYRMEAIGGKFRFRRDGAQGTEIVLELDA